jgi:nucleoredoxin
MSWDLALPLNDPRVAALSGTFKVEGIPTLVVIDKDGKTVTTDAREGVIADPEGFPWRTKSPRDLLAESKGFTDKSGASVSTASLLANDYLALYFSAHWCPPCRGFTPELAAWYTTKKASAGKTMDLIFVSSDKDEASFNEYLSEMPWKALAFSDRATKERLSKAFNVKGIPTLVVIDKEGNIVEASARGKVSNDPDGFPWGPRPCSSLEDATEFINEAPTVVLFTDKLTDAAAEVAVNEAFRAVADGFWSEGKPTTPLRFAIGGDGDEAVDSVRSFLGTTRDKDGPTAVRVDIIDVRGQKKASLQAEGGKLLTGAEMKAFVSGYLDGSVAGTSIRDKK